MKIVAFDFDGTITTKDTLFEFIKFTKGKCKFLLGLLLYSPLLVLSIINIFPRSKTKELLFRHFYKGTSLKQFNKWGEDFATYLSPMIRTQAIEEINKELKNESIVLIISASLENWILPWAVAQGIHIVISTRPEIDDAEKLTGNFASLNCSGPEKVNRLLELFPKRNEYTLWAYGDSRGDKQLIEFADKGWYNKFIN